MEACELLHAHGAPVTARQPHTARHGADEEEARLVESVGLDSQLVSNAACPVSRLRPIGPPGASWGSGRSYAPRSAA